MEEEGREEEKSIQRKRSAFRPTLDGQCLTKQTNNGKQ